MKIWLCSTSVDIVNKGKISQGDYFYLFFKKRKKIAARKSKRKSFVSSGTSLVAQADVKTACNAGDPGSIPGLGRPPGEGHGNPLQYSCLENPTDRGASRATVHGVTKNRTRLGN